MLFYELMVLVAGASAGEGMRGGGRREGGRETNAKAVYTIVVVELYSRGESSSVPGFLASKQALVPKRNNEPFSYHLGGTKR